MLHKEKKQTLLLRHAYSRVVMLKKIAAYGAFTHR